MKDILEWPIQQGKKVSNNHSQIMGIRCCVFSKKTSGAKRTMNSGRLCPLSKFVVSCVLPEEVFWRREVDVGLAHRAVRHLAHVELVANVFRMLRFVPEKRSFFARFQGQSQQKSLTKLSFDMITFLYDQKSILGMCLYLIN